MFYFSGNCKSRTLLREILHLKQYDYGIKCKLLWRMTKILYLKHCYYWLIYKLYLIKFVNKVISFDPLKNKEEPCPFFLQKPAAPKMHWSKHLLSFSSNIFFFAYFLLIFTFSPSYTLYRIDINSMADSSFRYLRLDPVLDLGLYNIAGTYCKTLFSGV